MQERPTEQGKGRQQLAAVLFAVWPASHDLLRHPGPDEGGSGRLEPLVPPLGIRATPPLGKNFGESAEDSNGPSARPPAGRPDQGLVSTILPFKNIGMRGVILHLGGVHGDGAVNTCVGGVWTGGANVEGC